MCLTVPGRIVSVDSSQPEAPTAVVAFAGGSRPVSLLYAPEAAVGDYVIVHAGFATEILPEAEAREALEYARQLNEVASSSATGPETAGG